MPDQRHPPPGAVVRTDDGSLTMTHPEHGEAYHSQSGAEAEARDLYVAASGLAARWAAPAAVRVLDVGLGLGYNAALTLESWRAAPAPPPLAVTSLEIDGALVAAFASGAAPWQATWSAARLDLCRALAPDGPALWTAVLPHPRGPAVATWRIVAADAASSPLPPAPAGGYTHVWQDPFSPARNPALWTPAWFAKVGAGAAPGCLLMTYSVARAVRDGLAAAGWQWRKIPAAQATKRHWLAATWPLSTT